MVTLFERDGMNDFDRGRRRNRVSRVESDTYSLFGRTGLVSIDECCEGAVMRQNTMLIAQLLLTITRRSTIMPDSPIIDQACIMETFFCAVCSVASAQSLD